MLVEKINDRMEPHVVQVDGVTLLSEDEYEAYKALIPPIHRWWWLRRVNAPVSGGYAGHVDLDGQVHYERVESDNGGVRPALTTSGFGAASLFPGDRFEARGKRWTVLSDSLAVCNDIVGKACFRESVDWTEKLADANEYEKSDIRKWLQKWWEGSLDEAEGGSFTGTDDSGPAYRARISERGGFEKADRIVAEQVWDAARKIASMGTDELFRLFGNEHFDVVIRRVSVTEAVKQVSAWERAKKEGSASKVRVGVEVRNAWGTAGKVVGIKGRNIYVLWCNMDRKEPMISKWDISQVAPTGRDFPDIADLLQDMAEIQKEKDG